MNNHQKTVVDHQVTKQPRGHKLLNGVILIISAIFLSCGINVNIFYDILLRTVLCISYSCILYDHRFSNFQEALYI